MTTPALISELVATFDRNRDSYRSPAYNEHQLRVEFLDPFFIALGWDVYNSAGYALPYRDVVHEDAIKIGVATKAPDYCFRVGGRRKFFLEAKKPSLDIKNNPEPAFQLRRYAWSAKLPLSILSDFEEFAVYDCRLKPEPRDPAAAGRVFFYRYPDYLERWPEIFSIFSKEAVLKGSFDKFAESAKKKKGTAEVDAAFLKEIESWREALAKNIALRNPRLTNRELNFAVQATLDRLIFLRICEDRGIENYGVLQALLNGQNLYRRLFQIFDRADDKYNSGLFHFKPEKDRPEPDTLTPRLKVDDKPLKEILKRLYYPESPYEFSVLPADILGQVYEQFLGKVIRLTAGHQAKVEDKPEVKKAGGVYYTPTYIVDYIVKNTVGKLLEGRSPTDVSGVPALRRGQVSRRKKKGGADISVCQPLRILDPACGSGSFLLGAYQYLLDWYHDQYVEESAKCTPLKGGAGSAQEDRKNLEHELEPERIVAATAPVADGRGAIHRASVGAGLALPKTGAASGAPTKIYQAAAGEWKLTIAERKRILLDHIFGVDIDPSAVEVTKLSLLLKCLEGESEETLKQMKLFHKERALPDLSHNIKCGNSLIGPDFFQGKQLSMFSEEERYRINVFDWEKEFPEVFQHSETEGTEKKLGVRELDPALAGPRLDAAASSPDRESPASSRRKKSGVQPPHSMSGFDVVIGNPPYGYMIHELQQEYFSKHYQHQDYQKDLYLLFLERYERMLKNDGLLGVIVSNTWLQSVTLRKIRQYLTTRYGWLRILHLPEKVFRAVVDTHVLIFQKANIQDSQSVVFAVDVRKESNIIESHKLKLQDLPQNGDAINIVSHTDAQNLYRKILDRSTSLSHICNVYNGTKPFEEGKGTPPQTKEIMEEKPFVKEGKRPSSEWSPLLRGSLIQRYKNLWKKDSWILYGPWLAAPRDPSIFKAPLKIMVRQTGDSIIATVVQGGFIARDNLHLILPSDETYNLCYILGIINSKLIDFTYTFINPEKGEALAQVKKKHVEILPVRPINFSKQADKALHDHMVKLVEMMLDLNKRLPAAKTPHEQESLERQIAATDQEIDKLVYELYNLSEEEIKIVEGRE